MKVDVPEIGKTFASFPEARGYLDELMKWPNNRPHEQFALIERSGSYGSAVSWTEEYPR